MRNDFLLVSNNFPPNPNPSVGTNVFEGEWFTLYTNKLDKNYKNSLVAFIDGYVLPRNSIYSNYENAEQVEIIKDLYIKYGDNVTSYIKGIFTIIIIDGDSIKLFTDQLGISKVFYFINNEKFCISNNYQLISSILSSSKVNKQALALKALLNREVNGQTILSDILFSAPATKIIFTKQATEVSTYWTVSSLLNKNDKTFDIDYFANLFKQNIQNNIATLSPYKTALTLTGGKDSRTALTALLCMGIKPVGVTYGNPETIDAVYASSLAKHAGIEHNIYNPEKTVEWFEQEAINVLNLNNPLINFHRSHRLYAFNKLKEQLGSNTSFYTGYMGGELLMGVYFDNLIFTNFIRDFWVNGRSQFDTISKLLYDSFLRLEGLDISALQEQLLLLKAFDNTESKKIMQFHSLFEIGVLHHSQDIQIAQQKLDYPLPFFLDFEFVEALFCSPYSFLHQNVETKNLLKRHSLFKFNLSLQHKFYPQLDNVYYAKRGTYNTAEFLKGPFYWSLIKTIRYFLEKKKYPATFSYNQNYKTFLIEHLNNIIIDKASPINEVYDVPRALESLKQQMSISTESPLHKYSNIVMHYMQYNLYTKLP